MKFSKSLFLFLLSSFCVFPLWGQPQFCNKLLWSEQATPIQNLSSEMEMKLVPSRSITLAVLPESFVGPEETKDLISYLRRKTNWRIFRYEFIPDTFLGLVFDEKDDGLNTLLHQVVIYGQRRARFPFITMNGPKWLEDRIDEAYKLAQQKGPDLLWEAVLHESGRWAVQTKNPNRQMLENLDIEAMLVMDGAKQPTQH